MIGQNHVVPSEYPETVEFDRDAMCRDIAAAIANRIDEEVLKCLSMTIGTTSSTPQTSALTASKLAEMPELIENSPISLELSPLTFESSDCDTRLVYTFGMAVQKSDPASAASPPLAA